MPPPQTRGEGGGDEGRVRHRFPEELAFLRAQWWVGIDKYGVGVFLQNAMHCQERQEFWQIGNRLQYAFDAVEFSERIDLSWEIGCSQDFIQERPQHRLVWISLARGRPFRGRYVTQVWKTTPFICTDGIHQQGRYPTEFRLQDLEAAPFPCGVQVRLQNQQGVLGVAGFFIQHLLPLRTWWDVMGVEKCLHLRVRGDVRANTLCQIKAVVLGMTEKDPQGGGACRSMGACIAGTGLMQQ